MRGSAAHWLAEPTPWNETIHPGFSPLAPSEMASMVVAQGVPPRTSAAAWTTATRSEIGSIRADRRILFIRVILE